MSRVIWKGAISFGLVHVPVALHPAAREGGIDFDWLDKRSLDPVGYKRINKRTGKEITSEHIVRGVKLEDDRYVVLGSDEIRAAYPKTTQTIAIEAFVSPTQIPFTLLQQPYYLVPLAKGEKVYALLREAMLADGVVGIARLVLHTKEHLAALAPAGPALMLNTLRWAGSMLPVADLKLPAEGAKANQLKEGELTLARRLIKDMTEDWQPERYQDQFTAAIQALVDRRAEAGDTAEVPSMETSAAPASGNVVDLTELLRQSLGGKKSGSNSGGSSGSDSSGTAGGRRRRAS